MHAHMMGHYVICGNKAQAEQFSISSSLVALYAGQCDRFLSGRSGL